MFIFGFKLGINNLLLKLLMNIIYLVGKNEWQFNNDIEPSTVCIE